MIDAEQHLTRIQKDDAGDGWTLVVMTDEEIGKLLHYQLETKFERIFATVQKFDGAAMFRERCPTRGIQKFYFSPRGTALLEQELAAEAQFPARPCLAPYREDVAFVTGDASACLLLHGRECS